MSGASRALRKLALHHQRLAVQHARQFPEGRRRPLYDGVDLHERAADMAARTAAEERWRERVPRWFRRWVLGRAG